MPSRRVHVWLVVSVIIFSVISCVPDDSTASSPPSAPPATTAPHPWAAEAMSWNEAFTQTEHFQNLLPQFFAEDVVFDDREQWGRDVVRGREQLLEYLIRALGSEVPFTYLEFLVSADEALHLTALDNTSTGTLYAMTRWSMGPTGIESGVVSVLLPNLREGEDPREDALAARSYVDLWNQSAATGIDNAALIEAYVPTLYDPDARINDTLLGKTMTGVPAITSSLLAKRWPYLPNLEIEMLPGGEGEAVFEGLSRDPSLPSQVHLIVNADDGSGCPGLMGIALAFQQGKILWERRFHEVESVRRCFDTEQLRDGWWVGIDIPEPIRREPTGTVQMGEAVSVEIYNGSGQAEDLVRWSMNRFATADLPLPRVKSITFLFDPDYCSDKGGSAIHDGDGTIVTLCIEARNVCSDDECHKWGLVPRYLLLHELAHAWISDYVDDDTRTTFLTQEGLSRWHDPEEAWEDRGSERAANTLMFGLMDETGIYGPAGPGQCEAWGPGFRLLTGVDPIAPDC
ncbi:MAG TPA: hypothetical protein VF148_07715 [Acidimicrobiia bacterium]